MLSFGPQVATAPSVQNYAKSQLTKKNDKAAEAEHQQKVQESAAQLAAKKAAEDKASEESRKQGTEAVKEKAAQLAAEKGAQQPGEQEDILYPVCGGVLL